LLFVALLTLFIGLYVSIVAYGTVYVSLRRRRKRRSKKHGSS
jgi:hypothetical protein